MFFLMCQQQNQFKTKGNNLFPACTKDQAQMYQRIFETITLSEKSGMLTLIYLGIWYVPKYEIFQLLSKTSKRTADPRDAIWS